MCTLSKSPRVPNNIFDILMSASITCARLRGTEQHILHVNVSVKHEDLDVSVDADINVPNMLFGTRVDMHTF